MNSSFLPTHQNPESRDINIVLIRFAKFDKIQATQFFTKVFSDNLNIFTRISKHFRIPIPENSQSKRDFSVNYIIRNLCYYLALSPFIQIPNLHGRNISDHLPNLKRPRQQ